jgi:ribosomal protein S18 acetylase RimI-like enzyme
MAATTRPLPAAHTEHLRRLNMRKDLRAVADLVELAFADELDSDGRRYIRQMRASARAPQMLGFAGYVPSSLGGFVWIEDEKLIGNLSMIPVQVHGRRSYLIANVAVHPKHRRKGIARALTLAALEDIQKRGGASAWLQVRANNAGAFELYKRLGFSETARRSTWHSAGTPLVSVEAGIRVRERRRSDWPEQQRWLRLAYPPALTWQLPLNIHDLRPGLGGAVNRMLNLRDFMQWACERDGELIGALTWQSSHSQADWLWLAAKDGEEDATLRALAPHALRHAPRGRRCAIDHPAGEQTETLQALGFSEHIQLIWMRLSFDD